MNPIVSEKDAIKFRSRSCENLKLHERKGGLGRDFRVGWCFEIDTPPVETKKLRLFSRVCHKSIFISSTWPNRSGVLENNKTKWCI